MSLAVRFHTDLDPYLDGAAFSANIVPFAYFGGQRNGFVYCDKLSLFLCQYHAPSSGQPDGFCFIDPSLVDNSTAAVGDVAYNTINNRPYFHIGAYDPVGNSQRLFRAENETTNRFYEQSLTTPATDVDSDPFPNVGTQNPRNAGPTLSTQDGYYDTGSPSEEGDWVFFPDWGPGYAVVLLRTVRFAGVTYAWVNCLVNLTTGEATPIAGWPGYFQATPANTYQSGLLFGRTQAMFYKQFEPDDDSTGSDPKGVLWQMSNCNNGSPQSARELFVIAVDWNPNGIVGTPNRVHLRERLRSRYIVDATGPLTEDTNVSVALTTDAFNFKLHPPTAALVSPIGKTPADATRGAGDVGWMEFPVQPVIDQLTKPAPRYAITTNRVVELRTEARGDLNELIAGLDVTWQVRRVSTRGEILATTGTPGETVTVANGPIDRAFAYPFEVYEDGIPLTETTHYTVNEAAGQVTFVGPKPLGGSVYSIDYTHLSTPVSPAFGTPLSTISVTDENGEASIRIRYPDDDADAGFIDRYDVTG